MKRMLLAGIAAVTLAFAPQLAGAADVPVRKAAPVAVAAAPTWSGLYIGINGGYLGYRADETARTTAGVFIGHTPTWENTNGGVIGGTVGWNWQIFPSWVIGVEGDWDWSDVRGSSITPALFTTGLKIKDVATVRGRIGWVWGTALLYVTGGGTWVHGTDFQQNPANLDTVSFDFNKSGANIGAGVEMMMTESLSVKIDWLYHDLGHQTFPGGVASAGGTFTSCAGAGSVCDVGLNFWTIRGGINWKFNLGKWPVGKTPAVVAKY